MSSVKAPLAIKLKVAKNGVKTLLKHPKYIALLIVFSTLGFIFINALLDVELLWTLATLDVASSIKVEAIADVLFDTSGYPLPNMLSIAIMALLFGYVLSASIFASRKLAVKQKARASSGGIAFGVLSSGCAACGTSLLAPLFTAIGITTTSAAITFGLYMNIVGILILTYSAYKISMTLAQLKNE